MILDAQERYVIGSTGWVERGGKFSRRDVKTGELASFVANDAAYLRLFSVDADRFLTAGPAPDDESLAFSIRRFDDPASPLWSLVVSPTAQQMSGNPAAFAGARCHHLAAFKNGGNWMFRVVTIYPGGENAALGELPWYNGNAYDMGYQGLTDVVQIPGSELILVSVQRSSIVVVHDPVTARDVSRFNLAGRGGNPKLTVVGNEVWTIDYDTFVRVDLNTSRVLQSVRVQPSPPGTQKFAGDLFHWPTKQQAVVPRPFSGDLVVIDPANGAIETTVSLQKQPLSCVVTKSGHIIARDWKSGDWMEGDIPA